MFDDDDDDDDDDVLNSRFSFLKVKQLRAFPGQTCHLRVLEDF